MELDDFIAKFEESLADLPEEPLKSDTDFKSLKTWDSLAILTVTDTVEFEYGVLLKKEDYMSCRTLQDLYDLVVSRR